MRGKIKYLIIVLLLGLAISSMVGFSTWNIHAQFVFKNEFNSYVDNAESPVLEEYITITNDGNTYQYKDVKDNLTSTIRSTKTENNELVQNTEAQTVNGKEQNPLAYNGNEFKVEVASTNKNNEKATWGNWQDNNSLTFTYHYYLKQDVSSNFYTTDTASVNATLTETVSCGTTNHNYEKPVKDSENNFCEPKEPGVYVCIITAVANNTTASTAAENLNFIENPAYENDTTVETEACAAVVEFTVLPYLGTKTNTIVSKSEQTSIQGVNTVNNNQQSNVSTLSTTSVFNKSVSAQSTVTLANDNDVTFTEEEGYFTTTYGGSSYTIKITSDLSAYVNGDDVEIGFTFDDDFENANASNDESFNAGSTTPHRATAHVYKKGTTEEDPRYTLKNPYVYYYIFKKQINFSNITWTDKDGKDTLSTVYNGTAQCPALQSDEIVSTDNVTLKVALVNDSGEFIDKDGNVTKDKSTYVTEWTNAGTYKVRPYIVYSTYSNNYEIIGNDTKEFTIEKLEVTITWENSTEAGFTKNQDGTYSITYDGNEHCPTATVNNAVTINGNTDDVTITLTITGDKATNGKAINAGDYTATASGLTGTKASNYKLPDSGLTKAFKIEKANFTVSFDDYTATYNGNDHFDNIKNNVSVTTVDDLTNYTVKYSTDKKTWSDTLTIQNAGTYNFYVKVIDNNGNHNDHTSDQPYTAKIEKADFEEVKFTSYTATYDGKDHFDNVKNNVSVTTVDGSINYTVQYSTDNKATWSDTLTMQNAGTYNFYVKVTDKNGNHNDHITEPCTAKIEQRAITITWENSTEIGFTKNQDGTYSITYDGKEHAPTATANNVIESDKQYLSVTVTVDGDKATNGKAINAGDYTATASGLTGDKADNYCLPESGLEQNFKINKATITITAQDQQINKGETPCDIFNETYFTLSGIVDGEDSSVITGTANVTFILRDSNGNDTTTSYTAEEIAGLDITETTTFTIEVDVNGLSADNYAITYEDGTLTVNTKTSVTKPTKNEGKTFTYNGEVQDLTTGLDNYNSSQSNLFTLSYYKGTVVSDENKITASDVINAGDYTVKVSLNNTATCQWSDGSTEALTFTWKIEKLEVTITWENSTEAGFTKNQDGTYSITYDGKEHAPTATVNNAVTINGNTDDVTIRVTVDGDKATDGKAINAGDYTATASELVGTKASNYKLPESGLTQAFKINKANFREVTVTPYNGTYDGKNHLPFTTIEITTASGATITITAKEERNYDISSTNNYDTSSLIVKINGIRLKGTTEYPAETDKISVLSTVDSLSFTITVSDDNHNEVTTDEVMAKVSKASLAVPTEGTTTFTYNGTSQTYSPTFADGVKDLVTIKETTSAINAGTYSVTVSLPNANNYQWSDGSTEPLTFTWKINKCKLSFDSAIEWNYNTSGVTLSTGLLTNLKTENDHKVTASSLLTITRAYNYNGITETNENEGKFYYTANNVIKVGSTYKIDVELTDDADKNYYFGKDLNNQSKESFTYLKYKTAKIYDASGNTKYYTIEDAIGKGAVTLESNSSGNKTYIITAFSNVDAYDTTSWTTSNDITLPYDATGSDSKYKDQTTLSNYNVGSVLTIPQDVILTITGTIDIRASIAQINNNDAGTVGTHAVIMNQGTINVEGGSIVAYGYLKGQGTVNLTENATVEDIFRTYDFKGGTHTLGIVGGKLLGIEEHNYFPINAYSIHNVSCKTVVNEGCVYKARYVIYMSSTTFSDTITIIGDSDSTNALFKISSGSVTKTAIGINGETKVTDLDTITGNNQTCGYKEKIEVDGTVVDGNMTINVSMSYSSINIVKMDMTTSIDNPLPIPYMDINVTRGSLTLQSASYKFMPGTSLTVEKGANLYVQNGVQLAFYTVDECKELESPAEFYASKDATTASSYPYDFYLNYCKNLTDAYLLVNGTVNVTDTGKLSGKITTSCEYATITIANVTTEIDVLDKMINQGGTVGIGSKLSFNYSSVTTRTSTTALGYAMYAKGLIYTSNEAPTQDSPFTAGTTYKSNGQYWYSVGTYTIKYYNKDGTLYATKSSTVGNPIGTENKPTDPTSKGYTFASSWYWIDDNGIQHNVDFSNDIFYADVILYADWSPNTYTVKYSLPDWYTNNFGSLENGKFTVPNSLTLPKLDSETINGVLYNFGGWYLSYDGDTYKDLVTELSVDNVKDNDSITVYAMFFTKPYELTFDLNADKYDGLSGFDQTDLTLTLKKNNKNDLLPLLDLTERDTAKSQYYFLGWYKTADCNTDDKVTADNFGNLDFNAEINVYTYTLYAKWAKKVEVKAELPDSVTSSTKKTVTLGYYYFGDSTLSETLDKITDVKETEITFDGYKFTGFTLNDTTYASVGDTTYTNDSSGYVLSVTNTLTINASAYSKDGATLTTGAESITLTADIRKIVKLSYSVTTTITYTHNHSYWVPFTTKTDTNVETGTFAINSIILNDNSFYSTDASVWFAGKDNANNKFYNFSEQSYIYLLEHDTVTITINNKTISNKAGITAQNKTVTYHFSIADTTGGTMTKTDNISYSVNGGGDNVENGVSRYVVKINNNSSDTASISWSGTISRTEDT